METYADIINALSKGDYFAQIQAVNDLKAKNETLANENEALANKNEALIKEKEALTKEKEAWANEKEAWANEKEAWANENLKLAKMLAAAETTSSKKRKD